MSTLSIPPQPTMSISNSSANNNTHNNDVYDALYKTQIPDKELEHLFAVHNTLDNDQLEIEFKQVTKSITQWLEVAHMTAFTIEQNVKKDIIEDLSPLLLSCQHMSPLIPILIELDEIIHETTTITKIQSEWSGLQHFISSVKKSMEESNEKQELFQLMSSILFQIDDLSLMIFQYQEKRHQDMQKEDGILIEIDNRVGPLFNDVERVYTKMTNEPPEDSSGLLTRKHLLVQERWENLRIEIDELKIELKEDRWLIVFKQVADQVDGMMDGLDKTVSQCYLMIQQIRESLSTSTSTSSTSSSSITNNTATNNNDLNQMEKLRSVEKNFDAKYKYYTPSIQKMLMMLGNGIAARVSKNASTLNRHEQMLARWNQLKITMDNLRKKDLPENRPMSPATSICWSRLSDRSNDSNYLLKSPDLMMERSRSPYSPISFNNMKSPSPVYNNRQMSPSKRSNLIPSNSINTRHQQQQTPNEEEEDDDLNTNDFKRTNVVVTPTTPSFRSKSGLTNRSMTPRSQSRSGTPSMIPRPKTPNSSMIPRPQSRIQQQNSPRMISSPMHQNGSRYKPNPKDPLDKEIAIIINSSPIPIQCQKANHEGRYYFGNELTPSLGGGKKIYTCKLMTYDNNRNQQQKRNKVLIRVGGGWQDLEIFLLEHMNLMGG